LKVKEKKVKILIQNISPKFQILKIIIYN